MIHWNCFKEGDVVVMGTDALWDHLYPEKIIEKINLDLSAEENANNLVEAVFKIEPRSECRDPLSR
ncbi:hypothetical protein [Candidatus Cardinium sp. TP]|uniref:hypothetical protein n=1 Tax=Candidatus Cardinium sp. TP TaxID=2961955 RepID=UPI0021AFCCCD|nr:hypothetical protein [Candidatus Cardinium sp. TP]MCT4697210.1 hypothetical protein [Candidatus Cardinium sp. TP]